jgi:hypothetical protein
MKIENIIIHYLSSNKLIMITYSFNESSISILKLDFNI